MYKEKVFEFMREKNKILKKMTGVEYFNESDENDLQENFTEQDAYNFIERIKNNDITKLSDAAACPFCFYNENYLNNSCSFCSYGGRHGMCSEEDEDGNLISDYDIIKKLLLKKIIEVPEIIEIVERLVKSEGCNGK